MRQPPRVNESGTAAPSPVPPGKSRLPRGEALQRERFAELGKRLWERRLTLIVAPAGAGKSTLLVQLAQSAGVPVAYCCADPSDQDPAVLLGRLGKAFAAALPGVDDEWVTAEEAASSLSSRLASRALLLIDDFHVLRNSEAERMVEALVEHAPSELGVVIASRSRPGFDVSRLLVTDELIEVGPDDLRFRSWETERLFRDLYRDPLPPEQLAELTRRTEGWAAGLKLFHLATKGKPPSLRRRTLSAIGSGSELVREYLTRNVLDELPEECRSFLIDTCVLGRLSVPLCNEFLGRDDAEGILRELRRRQMFLQPLGDGQFRLHDVLRSCLEALLVERMESGELNDRYRRAGQLLERVGAFAEAMRAYCRGEAWDALAHLLGHNGHRLADEPLLPLDLLPPWLVDEDPWLLLVSARQHRAAGRFAEAVRLYRLVERSFGRAAGAQASRRERLTLSMWLEPDVSLSHDAAGLIRAAVNGDPAAARRCAGRLTGPEGTLARGLCALLTGACDDAAELLVAARASDEAGPELACIAWLGEAVARLLAGDCAGEDVALHAAEAAEVFGFPWLMRLARACRALSGHQADLAEARAAQEWSRSTDDRWGAALAWLMEGLGTLVGDGNPIPPLEDARAAFRDLGAGSLEAWARSALALAAARGRDSEALQLSREAESFARSSAVKWAQGVAHLAAAEAEPASASEYLGLATGLESDYAVSLGVLRRQEAAAAPPLELSCFGGLSVRIHGQELDLSSLKPRVRQLLRLLAVRAGQPAHREVLMEALWPDGDPVASARNLHVLVSSLRHALEAGWSGASSLVLREGDAYRLAVPDGSRIDVLEFDRALREARVLRDGGDPQSSLDAYNRSLELYRGELLPGEGPAEWIVSEREYRRAQACEAACGAAELLLESGQPSAAAFTCERGLAADPYHDGLWRLAIVAYERAGAIARAARARSRYAQVLERLGVPA